MCQGGCSIMYIVSVCRIIYIIILSYRTHMRPYGTPLVSVSIPFPSNMFVSWWRIRSSPSRFHFEFVLVTSARAWREHCVHIMKGKPSLTSICIVDKEMIPLCSCTVNGVLICHVTISWALPLNNPWRRICCLLELMNQFSFLYIRSVVWLVLVPKNVAHSWICPIDW